MIEDPSDGYPVRYEELAKLEGGEEVFLRPIKETDGALLVDLFHKLSPRSIYLRFLSPMHDLPDKWVYHFTHMDYFKDFALVGVTREEGKDSIIAVGRYSYDSKADRTEIAVVVRDDWQGKGLGKILLSRVVEIAKEKGFSRFEAIIDTENRIIMRIIRESGYNYKIHYEGGVYRMEMDA